MEKIITSDNVELFAHTNAELIDARTARAVAVCFHGLNNTNFIRDHSEPEFFYAKNGILYVFPYYDPWGWMNRECVALTDEIVDVIKEKYGLPGDIPVASTGGSMGGMACIVYAAFSRQKITVCAANSPVCDFPYHYTERPDLPRTIYHALRGYGGSLEEAMESISPLHIAEKLPDIPYYFVHGDADTAVGKAMHSDRMVARLREIGRSVVYDEVPGMLHTKLDFEHAAKYYSFIADHV